jgi:hypothetical protein
LFVQDCIYSFNSVHCVYIYMYNDEGSLHLQTKGKGEVLWRNPNVRPSWVILCIYIHTHTQTRAHAHTHTHSLSLSLSHTHLSGVLLN